MDERSYVRELARKVAALAASDEYEARRRRWRDVNALRKPDRPPVYCRPVGCWPEILPDADLQCQDPALRGVEAALRHHLIKDDIGDDSLIPPFWPVAAAVRQEGRHTWGVEIRRIRPDSPGGAWRYDPPIKEEADLDRLRAPEFVHNEAETARRLDAARELLGDILPVRVTGGLPLSPTMCTAAADLVGLDALMLNMAARPEMIHRLMAFLQRATLRSMDRLEAMCVLSENNHGEMYCSDSLKTSPPSEPVRVGDLWGAANSQEFDQVSPAMWEEFLLDYQRPILERFALVSYGCCENLTQKIEGVLGIPNLRIFVSSAWTDLAKVVEAVGDRCTIMWRQKASDVVFPDDLSGQRRHLREGLRIAKGCYVQIVLRELQTLRGHPRRLHEWARIAKEEAAAHC